MRTTQTMTISLPPAMVKVFERVRKAESRTRSELVREALRSYFEERCPTAKPTKAELAAILKGEAEIKRGRYVTLTELLHALEPAGRKVSAKAPRKSFR